MTETDSAETNTAMTTYNSYVLRMWQEADTNAWRATLRNTRNGEQHNFVALSSLLEFLTTNARINVTTPDSGCRGEIR